MNVANLQLEGLLMAIAAVNHLLVQKGVVSMQEIDAALQAAEASENRSDELPPSYRRRLRFLSGCCNWRTSASRRRSCRPSRN